MAWFKMSIELLHCAVAVDISRRRPGDSAADYRMMIFIRLLMLAANGVNDLRDARDLASVLGAKLWQVQRVWDSCVLNNVLRQTCAGFGAAEWLAENGYLEDDQ